MFPVSWPDFGAPWITSTLITITADGTSTQHTFALQYCARASSASLRVQYSSGIGVKLFQRLTEIISPQKHAKLREMALILRPAYSHLLGKILLRPIFPIASSIAHLRLFGREKTEMSMIPRFSATARQAAMASTSAKAKQHKNEVRVRHKGVLKGLEEAQRMHKPQGWSKSLQEFADQPYQGSNSPEAAEMSHADTSTASTEIAATSIPRKKGVTDGPWDRIDDEAMIEALTNGPGKSKGESTSLINFWWHSWRQSLSLVVYHSTILKVYFFLKYPRPSLWCRSAPASINFLPQEDGSLANYIAEHIHYSLAALSASSYKTWESRLLTSFKCLQVRYKVRGLPSKTRKDPWDYSCHRRSPSAARQVSTRIRAAPCQPQPTKIQRRANTQRAPKRGQKHCRHFKCEHSLHICLFGKVMLLQAVQ